MELKPGYKQTEVGVIPEDWDVRFLDEICQMKSGSSITSASIDDYSEFPCYGGNGLRGYAKEYTHEGNYALIGRQGAHCGNVVSVKGKFFASEHAVVVSALNHIDIDWLAVILKDMNLNRFSESSAQPGLSVSKILKLKIPLPPTKEEQTAIADALSDADALIAALEKLIAKKRQIKQGAMQTLLNPHDENGRLKAGWVVKTLGEIAELATGSTPTTKDRANYGNDFLFVSPADLGKNVWITNTEKKLSAKGFSLARKFPVNSILFTCIGSTIGKSGIASVELTSNQQINAVLPNESYSSHYLYYFLRLVTPVIQASASEQAVPIINKTQFGETQIPLPCDKEEQTRIAAILSDMDAELDALEAKRAKANALKQGMMQNLLTGRIRLVKPQKRRNDG
jgi:type I restriction enzyme S subunit